MGKPIEILLVDDNEDDILLTLEAFDLAGAPSAFKTVRDGEEALQYLRREGSFQSVKLPNLVLLDINMPKLNGFEVLDAMKSDSALRRIPVIMLTTSSSSEDILRSYAKGASSFISKPEEFDQFIHLAETFSTYWSQVSRIPA